MCEIANISLSIISDDIVSFIKLLQHNKNINKNYQFSIFRGTILKYCIFEQRNSFIKILLLDFNANITTEDIFTSITRGNIEIFQLLIENSNLINSNINNVKILHVIIKCNRVEYLSYLLKKYN